MRNKNSKSLPAIIIVVLFLSLFGIPAQQVSGQFTNVSCNGQVNFDVVPKTISSLNENFILQSRATVSGECLIYQDYYSFAVQVKYEPEVLVDERRVTRSVSDSKIDFDTGTSLRLLGFTNQTINSGDVLKFYARVFAIYNSPLTPTDSDQWRQLAESSHISMTYSPGPASEGTSGVPAAPTNLKATVAGANQINLSWTDNSDNETGFKVERGIGASGSYSEIATVGPNITSYEDKSVSPGTQYSYRVLAANASGTSPNPPEASATTSGSPSPSPGPTPSPSPSGSSQPQSTAQQPSSTALPETEFLDACKKGSPLAACIKSIYLLSLGLGTLIALLMIVLAGYRYMTAQGNAQQVESAKEAFASAFIGLIILFIGFILLRVINPDLVRFTDLQLPDIPKSAPASTPSPTPTTTPTTTPTR